MARRLQDKLNAIAPGGAYPYGRAKDNTGSNNGVPVNESLLGDLLQFFERIMVVGGVSHNLQPENNSDGFQYVTSLINIIVAQATTLVNAEAATRLAADTTLQNNINGKLAVGNVAPDNVTLEVNTGILRLKEVYELTQNTNGSGSAETYLTIAVPNNGLLSVDANLVSKYVSGGSGSAGDGSNHRKLATFKNVAGVVSQVGVDTVLQVEATTGAASSLSFAVSGTNILVRVTSSGGNVFNTRVTAMCKAI